MKKFLVPVDFSKSALEAVRYAVKLAKPQEAEVILLHVIDVRFNWPLTGPVNIPKLRQEMWAEAETKLAAVVQAMKPSRVPLHPVIMEGAPWEATAAQAGHGPVDMIVLGQRPKPPWWQIFRRHTARRIAQHAYCPVLTLAWDSREGML